MSATTLEARRVAVREYSQVAPPFARDVCAAVRSVAAKRRHPMATGATAASTRIPREFAPSELYEPALAKKEAWRQFRAEKITAAQRDALLRFAKPP